MSENNNSILTEGTLFVLEVSTWCGMGSLTNDEKGSFISQSWVKGGQFDIFPKDSLKWQAKFSKRAERLGLKFGTRLAGGYFIPKDNVADFKNELQKLDSDYVQDKAEFIASFDTSFGEFLANTEGKPAVWSNLVVDKVPHRDEVDSQIGFHWYSWDLANHKGSQTPAEVMSTSVYDEISVFCRAIRKDLFEKSRKRHLTGKTFKKRMEPILSKLSHFAMANSKFSEIKNTLSGFLSEIGEEALNVKALDQAQALLVMMSDAETISDVVEANFGLSQVLSITASSEFDDEDDACL